MPVNDYSTTPASNGSISGINIAEGCPPAGINDAIRQVLADIAGWRTGSVGTLFTGGGTMAGSYTFSGPVTLSSTVTLSSPLGVAQGGTGVTTSTGTGSVVLSASPSFTGTVNFGPAIVTGSGVSTGDAQLEVGGNRSGNGPAYMDLHAVAGGDFNARVFRGSGANGNMEIVNAGTGVLSIATNATEKMRIDASGNVMVGTTSATGRLTVQSAGSDVGYFDTTDTTGGPKILAIRSIAASGTSTPTLALRQWRTSFAGSQNAGEIRFDGLTTTGSYAEFASIYATSGANSASGAPTAITFQTMNASYVTGERMRIDSAGNVMVGTTSATGLFSVNGVSYGVMIATDRFGILGNNLYFGGGNFRYIGNGHAYGWTQGNTDGADLRLLYAGNNTSGAGAVATTSERIYITSSGFVGVGTSTDNGVDKLTVAGIVGSYVSGRAGFHLYNGGATAEWFIGQPSASSHNLTFSKLVSGTYTDYVAIDSTGNVGIGTISPGERLTVSGNVSATGNVAAAGSVSAGGIELGYRDLPVVGSLTRGACFPTSAGVTIDTATAGNLFTIYNDSGTAITLTQGAGMTLRLAGTTTTGNRTLAARGFANVWYRSGSEAVVSGSVS